MVMKMMQKHQDKRQVFGKSLVFGSLGLLMAGALGLSATTVLADEKTSFESFKDCISLENAMVRLKCYDAFAKGGVYSPETAQKDLIDTIGKQTEIEAARNDTPDEVTVEIVRMWKNPYGMARFRTSDGQVWRQTSGNGMRAKEVPFKAVIKKGFGTSYYLSPEGTSRTVNVRRSQ